MEKKNDVLTTGASFEDMLNELEHIVARLENKGLSLEEAISEFERGMHLARQGQIKLKQAEQRVQILLSDNEDVTTTSFIQDDE